MDLITIYIHQNMKMQQISIDEIVQQAHPCLHSHIGTLGRISIDDSKRKKELIRIINRKMKDKT